MGRGARTTNNVIAAARPRAEKITRMTVYRAGDLTPPDDYGPSADVYAAVDACKPADGRQGRVGALFCSPDLDGLGRWTHANKTFKMPWKPNQLSVNPDNVWVYEINAWERASFGNVTDADRHAFWETGIRLRDWPTQAQERGLNGHDWEILLPPSALISNKPVGLRRLISSNSNEYRRKELMRTFEPRKAFRGEYW